MAKSILGTTIAELRKRKNLTQDDLAIAIGKSKSTIAMWETGQRDPDTQMIIKLSEFFNVSTDYLLGQSDVPEKDDYSLVITNGPIDAEGNVAELDLNERHFVFFFDNTLKNREAFAYVVQDDSMSGDNVFKGDVVVAVKNEEIGPNELAVVAVDNGFGVLRRIKQQDTMCILIPSNTTMQPELFPLEKVKILGKVVRLILRPELRGDI